MPSKYYKGMLNYFSIRKLIFVCVSFILIFASRSKVERYGENYKQNKDIKSLERAVELIEVGCDTSYLKQILGEPINFGFDYRYLTNTKGENGCPMGAVFWIDSLGTVSSQGILEICE